MRYKHYFRKSIFTGLCLILIPNTALSAQSENMLISVVRNIILGAAEVALDEAGTRIVGPTAWKYLRKVIQPVYESLTKRFPNLKQTGTEKAKLAAQFAAEELSKNRDLQKRILKRFAELKKGQEEIIAEINRISKTLERSSETVEKTYLNTQEILDELNRQRVKEPTESLKEISQLKLLQKRWAGLSREKWRKVKIMHISQMYVTEVLENGKPNRTYSYTTSDGVAYDDFKSRRPLFLSMPTTHYVKTSGAYKNESGVVCKKVWITFFLDGTAYKALSFEEAENIILGYKISGESPSIYCRYEGVWKLFSTQPGRRWVPPLRRRGKFIE